MGSVAECLPTTYVFEGMRSLLLDGVWRPELVVRAFGLNSLYISPWSRLLLISFRIARKHGLLLQSGE